VQEWRIRWESEQPVVYVMSPWIGSLRGSFSTVRATAVRQKVKRNTSRTQRNMNGTGRRSKGLVYYVIDKLNKAHLAGDPKRKGWGIHLQVWANIQSHRHKE